MAIWSWLREWVDELHTSDPTRLLRLTSELERPAAARAARAGMDADAAARARARQRRAPAARPPALRTDLHADRGRGHDGHEVHWRAGRRGRSTSRIELLASVDRAGPTSTTAMSPTSPCAHEAFADELACSTSCRRPATQWCCAPATGPSACTARTSDPIRFTGESKSTPRAPRHASPAGCIYIARATTRFRGILPARRPGRLHAHGRDDRRRRACIDAPGGATAALRRPDVRLGAPGPRPAYG